MDVIVASISTWEPTENEASVIDGDGTLSLWDRSTSVVIDGVERFYDVMWFWKTKSGGWDVQYRSPRIKTRVVQTGPEYEYSTWQAARLAALEAVNGQSN